MAPDPGHPVAGQGGVDDHIDVTPVLQTIARLGDDIEPRFLILRKLMDSTNRVNPGALLDEVLQQVHDTFGSILPYQRVGLALLDDRGENLEQRWVQSSSGAVKIPVGYSAPLRKTSLGDVLTSGEPRIINDLSMHLVGRHTSEHTRLLLEEGTRANLTVPLVASGKAIGFLFFSGSRTGLYQSPHAAAMARIAGPLSALLSTARLYEMVLKAQQESDRLLRNVLPAPIVKRLKAGEEVIADGILSATVVFVDIVNFVKTASVLSPTAVVVVLNRIFSAFDALCEQYGVEKIKTIGDAYMLATGVPNPMKNHTAVAACIALDMQELGRRFGTREEGQLTFRIGMHTGPVIAGVIGTQKFSYDLWGDTVNIASRMESHGVPGRIHVTRTVYDRLKDDFEFESRGATHLKGMGEMETFFLNAARPDGAYRSNALSLLGGSKAGAGAGDAADDDTPGEDRRRRGQS